MIHRRIVGLTVGVRRLLALSIGLGLAVSATWVAQGVLIALIVQRILDGGGWTEIAGFVAGDDLVIKHLPAIYYSTHSGYYSAPQPQ